MLHIRYSIMMLFTDTEQSHLKRVITKLNQEVKLGTNSGCQTQELDLILQHQSVHHNKTVVIGVK